MSKPDPAAREIADLIREVIKAKDAKPRYVGRKAFRTGR